MEQTSAGVGVPQTRLCNCDCFLNSSLIKNHTAYMHFFLEMNIFLLSSPVFSPQFSLASQVV